MRDNSLLTQANEHARSGDHAKALSHLLSYFSICRHEIVANLVETIAQNLTTTRAPIVSAKSTKKAQLEAWIRRVKEVSQHPADLTLLLQYLADGNSKEALERLSALKTLAPDPRLGRALMALFEKPPFQAGTTKKFWQLAADLLPKHADTSLYARLTNIDGAMVRVLNGAQTMGATLNGLVESMLMQVPQPDLVELSEEEKTILNHMANTLRAEAEKDAEESGLKQKRPQEILLEEIKKIDWSSLEDAYGSAENAPEILKQLFSDDLSKQNEAVENVRSSLVHQGTVSSATVPFFRIVLQFLDSPDFKIPPNILIPFAEAIETDLTTALGPAEKRPNLKKTPPELRPYYEVVDLMTKSAPKIANYLTHPDATTRAYAVYILTLLREKETAKVNYPVLRALFDQETDESVLAMAIVGAHILRKIIGNKNNAQWPAQKLAAVRHSPILEAACAIAAALVSGEEIDAVCLSSLRQAQSRKLHAERFFWKDGDIAACALEIEQSLNLKTDAQLLDDLREVLNETSPRYQQVNTNIVRRLFGSDYTTTPKKTIDQLSPTQIEYLNLLLERANQTPDPDSYPTWPFLESKQLWRTTKTLRTFLGKSPKGPLDLPVFFRGQAVPLWKLLSDRIYGYATRDEFEQIVAQLPAETIVQALEQIGNEGWVTYELNIHYKWVRDDGAPHSQWSSSSIEQNHNSRYADLLASLAVFAKEPGERWATELAERELAIVPPKFRSGENCATAITALTRFAVAKNQVLDERYDPLVAECISTAPVQRAPERTEEVLGQLPIVRAEKILIQYVGVFRIGRVTTTDKGVTTNYDTIFFDDSLRYVKALRSPSIAIATRLILAVEEWARVKAQTPKNATPVPELPKAEIQNYLMWVGPVAKELLELAIKRQQDDGIDLSWARKLVLPPSGTAPQIVGKNLGARCHRLPG